MEQSEHFKSANQVSKEFEQQIKKCDDALLLLEKVCEEVMKEIEDHFVKCLNFLAARQASLIGELDTVLKDQKKQLEMVKVTLKTSMDGCEELLRSGAALYKASRDIADNIWKESRKLPFPQIETESVKVDLPLGLFKLIQKHGKVILGGTRAVEYNPSSIHNSLPSKTSSLWRSAYGSDDEAIPQNPFK